MQLLNLKYVATVHFFALYWFWQINHKSKNYGDFQRVMSRKLNKNPVLLPVYCLKIKNYQEFPNQQFDKSQVRVVYGMLFLGFSIACIYEWVPFPVDVPFTG